MKISKTPFSQEQEKLVAERERGERLNTGGKKNGGGVGEFLESWSPLVSKLVSYLFMKRSGERRIPEMRDGKKIFRRMRRIVMEIRNTSVRGFLAQFKRLSPPCPVARAISLSLSLESPCPFFFVFASFVKNNFISPLFFFFCLPVGIVEFISLRSSESATGTEGGGKKRKGNCRFSGQRSGIGDVRSILKKRNRSFYIENSIGIQRQWGLNWARMHLGSLFFE